MFRVVIPVRYASTRLPGKALRVIGGQPMVRRVYERAVASGATSVCVATDDQRIAQVCRQFGAEVVLTAATHASGTDRIAEVVARAGWPDTDIVVNVQGDEPLLPPALVRQVAALLTTHDWAGVATLATPIGSIEEFLNPNVVKVAVGAGGRALYFSRAPVPWPRAGATQGILSQSRFDCALRHLGLYAYRVAALKRLAALPASALERTESLEQLRALEDGIAIAVAIAQEPPGPGVDTEEDLARVARILDSQPTRQ